MSISYAVISCMITISSSLPLQISEGYEGNRKPQPHQKEHEKQIADPSQDPLMDGFWPSSRMIHLALTRLIDDVSQKYSLSGSQRQHTQKNAIDRWERFLQQHRSTVQPLMNEFLEMRLELEPPSKKRVQEWAKRVMPVFEKYKKEMDRATQEFRKVLNPIQQDEFDVDMMQMGAAMRIAGGTLHRWQLGEFDPKFFWEPHEGSRDTLQSETHMGNRAANSNEKIVANTRKENDPILNELDAWEQYIEKFIRDYKLDEGQRDAARSCLSELKLRANAHRERYRVEVAQLEKRIMTNNGGEKELEFIKTLLDKLYGPIDDMFAELKHRLDQIPTESQKDRAAKNNKLTNPTEPSTRRAEKKSNK